MNAFEILALMQKRDGDKSFTDGKFATVTTDSYNDYYHDQLPTIPAGTRLCLKHGGDYGMYAIAYIDGILHDVKFKLNEVHHIDWASLSDTANA